MGGPRYAAVPTDSLPASLNASPELSQSTWAPPAGRRQTASRRRLLLIVTGAIFLGILIGYRSDSGGWSQRIVQGVKDQTGWHSGSGAEGAWSEKPQAQAEAPQQDGWHPANAQDEPMEIVEGITGAVSTEIAAEPATAPSTEPTTPQEPANGMQEPTTTPTPTSTMAVSETVFPDHAKAWTPVNGPSAEALPNPYLFGDFYDALKPASEERYLTAVPLGGISNQMKGVLNLIVLGHRTGRALILPPIIPNLHQRKHRRGPSYSTFYDIPRLSESLGGLPMLDWNAVRAAAPYQTSGKGWEWAGTNRWTEAAQPLPCYVAAHMGGVAEDGGRPLAPPFAMGLFLQVQASYAPGDATKGSWRTMEVAEEVVTANTSVVLRNGVEKDLTCLTESYWMQDAQGGMWDILGKMRFSEALEEFADETIAVSLEIDQAVVRQTRFVTAHVRRADVVQKCAPAPENWESYFQHGDSPASDVSRRSRGPLDDDELAPNSGSGALLQARGKKVGGKRPWQDCHFTTAYIIRRINDLRAKLGDPDLPVLLATDDSDPTSLAEFDAQPGFKRVKRVPANGKKRQEWADFWEVMVDTAILTRGVGFIGTDVSTMSRMAAERGRVWYDRKPAWF